MIQVYINDTELDTYESTGIGITYQSASLFSLELRGGHFTNQFTVPLTSKNKKIFENAHITNSDTKIPYMFNKCSIVMDGVEVLSDGFLIIESATDDKISISVLSGNSDFFNVIKNLNLNDLDFSAYQHRLVTDDVFPLTATTEGIVYPLMDWDDYDSSLNVYLEEVLMFNIGLQLPAFYLKTLLELIGIYTGWTISGTLFSDTNFLKKTFSCNKYTKTIDVTNIHTLSRITSDNIFFSRAETYGSVTGNFIRTDITVPFNSFDSSWIISNAMILCEKTTNYELTYNWKLNLVVPLSNQTSVTIRWCEVDSSGNYVAECLWRSQKFDFIYDHRAPYAVVNQTENITVNETQHATYFFENGKYYKPFLYYMIDTMFYNDSYTFSFTINKDTNIIIQETTTACPLDTVDGDFNFYDWKATDFIKDIIKLFGVNLQANAISKELIFDLFEDLDIEAEDWSEKVDISKEINTNFNYGSYAQKNYMKFQEEADIDSTFFTIDDSTLKDNGVALTMGVTNVEPFNLPTARFFSYTFLSCKGRIFSVENRLLQAAENLETDLGVIKRYGSLGLIPKIEKSKPFFIDIIFNTPTTNVYALSEIGYTNTLDLDFIRYFSTSVAFGRAMSMETQKTDYYTLLINMLNNIKVVNCYLNLSNVDIYNLKFSKAKKMFNQRMNDNFYLAKVENFKTGKSTKCTFIKI